MSPEEATRLQENVNKGAVKGHGNRVLAPYIKEATLVKKGVQKSTSKGSKAKGEMELVIMGMFPDYKKEFAFSPERKFRADFYIPSINCCIEYEGIYVGSEEMSGHTSMSGFTKDTEKYNLMTILGFKVLRYTNKNYGSMGQDLWTLKYPVI